MADGIVEIRDYTIESEWWEPYRTWAEEVAVPVLAAKLDLVDFWVDDGIEAEMAGSNPVAPANGQANVCWVIRWPSQEARNAGWKELRDDPQWQEAWSKHPNPDGYLQVNVRFMRSAL